MDTTSLLSVETITLALAVFALTWTVRHVCEFFPGVRDSRAWKVLVLPTLAIAVGAGLGLVVTTVIHGVVCGLLSTLVYDRVKKAITG